MSKACVFFADGLEECEALIVVDVLRRAGVEVTTASIRPVSSRWRSSFSSYPGKPSTLGATRSWSSSRKLLESSSMASRR